MAVLPLRRSATPTTGLRTLSSSSRHDTYIRMSPRGLASKGITESTLRLRGRTIHTYKSTDGRVSPAVATKPISSRTQRVSKGLPRGSQQASHRRRREAAAAQPSPSRQNGIEPEDLSPDTIDRFMVRETSNKKTKVAIWTANDKGKDVSAGIFLPWSRITTNPRKPAQVRGLGVTNIMGCTALLLVSNKGAFLGHYCEAVSFNMDTEEQGGVFTDQEDAFQQTVLEAWERGGKHHVSLRKLANEDAFGDTLNAFLWIPATGWAAVGMGQRDPYRAYWDRMKARLVEIFPLLADPERGIVEIRYDPVQQEDIRPPQGMEEAEIEGEDALVDGNPLLDTATGKILVKYHPNCDGKNQGTNEYVVWIEREKMLQCQWRN